MRKYYNNDHSSEYQTEELRNVFDISGVGLSRIEITRSVINVAYARGCWLRIAVKVNYFKEF